ncbi:MAG: alginate export family protein [Gemmatimonadota bacterium]|nr:alginate export family protein [Gemmatimonadota bacterium]MDH5758556.1 alginate export family protein [Gemmatimonadota bacterium]
MFRNRWLAIGASLVMASPLVAQEVTFHGQIRPRYEVLRRGANDVDEFTSMRVRAAVQALIDANLTVFIELQDVRLWGEETNTLTDYRADNLDLHQGYIRYKGKKLDWLTAMIGRQETNLGGQRLVGAVGWTQQGRSFDGARFDIAPGGAFAGSVVAYKIAEETAPTQDNDVEVYGAYGTIQDVGPGNLDVYLLYDRTDGAPAVESNRYTFGSRWDIVTPIQGTIKGRLEASMQRGTVGSDDVSAYMFGARLGTTVANGKGGVTLWYDHLSGDDRPGDGEIKVFNTLFATNHKFYGFADLFLDIPAHTGGHGLRDMAVKLNWSPAPDVSVGADLHTFRAAQQSTLTTAKFADELDLTVSHRYTPNLTMTSGLSYVRNADGLTEIGHRFAGSESITWFYMMLNATF